MAPEIWGGEGGPPSDLYGLAATYVELRQGRPALQFGRGADVMFAHLDGLLDFADFIGEAERAALSKAMARMPEDRHPTCLAFAEELAAALGRSVVKRSGRVPVPAARPVPTPSERATGTIAPGQETRMGAGTVRTGTPPLPLKPPTPETRVAQDTAPDTRVRPPRPPSKRGLIVAAVATAVLLGAVGFVIWMVFGGGGQPTGDTRPTNDTGTGGGNSWPIGNGITLIAANTGGDGGPKVIVPTGTEAEPGAAMIDVAGRGKRPQWVVARRGPHAVRFRLITPTGAANLPEPFYIAESKVWNKLYRESRDELPAAGELGGDDAPVVNITANDAAAFAAKLGGRLPTPDEWDHAAGYYTRGNLGGPVVAGGEAGRTHIAMPVATHGPDADRARNQFDLIDMATNGREWTSAVLPKRGEPFRIVAGPAFQPKDLVVLRGRTYTHRTPLTYEMMKYEEKEPQTGFAGVTSPYTGFRVLLPLP
jgi:hypothetical protein